MTAIDKLDAQTVASLLAIIIPALTALLTKWNVSSLVRTLVAAFLAAAAGAVGTLVAADGGFNWQTFVLSTLYAFVVQVALYMGVYKPQGITEKIAQLAPNFGLGTPLAPVAPVVPDAPVAPVVPDAPVVADEVAQDDDSAPEPDVEDDLSAEESELAVTELSKPDDPQ